MKTARCWDEHQERMRSGEIGSLSWSRVGIPVGPFRDRALQLWEDGIPFSELERRAGLSDSRLTRMLGLRPYADRRRRGAKTQRFLTRRNAYRLCRALDLDPVDVGL